MPDRQTRRRSPIACTTLLALSPPLDASARVTVTKRRAVSVLQSSAAWSCAPTRPLSSSIAFFSPSPPTVGPGATLARFVRLCRCRIGAARWRWKVGVHEHVPSGAATAEGRGIGEATRPRSLARRVGRGRIGGETRGMMAGREGDHKTPPRSFNHLLPPPLPSLGSDAGISSSTRHLFCVRSYSGSKVRTTDGLMNCSADAASLIEGTRVYSIVGNKRNDA